MSSTRNCHPPNTKAADQSGRRNQEVFRRGVVRRAMSSPTAASPPRGRRPWLPWRRYPRTAVAAEILLVALLGSWLGILVGGNVNVPVGPVQTRMSFTPALTGDAVLAVPPLGRLTLDSHDGPLRLDAQVTRVNMADARRIFADPATLQGLPERAASDVRHGLVRLA